MSWWERQSCGVLSAILAVAFGAAVPVLAADPEGCLNCHRYGGLARVAENGKDILIYQVNPDYFERTLGPHSRLKCSDCHPRREVEVIPHQAVSPVNCTTACHLTAPGSVEVRFSHDRIAGMLQDSVHTRDVLNKSNELLGSPLREGQARCLLCHNEPVFRRAGENWVQRQAPVNRCEVCHDPQLQVPMGAQYMYWHVFARSRPARTHADLVRVCALCHANKDVRKAYELPDTVASYLVSFHGRAMQLGSEETAGCLDCHVGQLQNVHQMQSREAAGSPTSSARVADTCRSPACHPTAGHRISAAAVHLDLATGRGIEYLIAFVFVLLIISTFGPSLVIQCLEILQIVIGREDPRHHEFLSMAERLQEDPRGQHKLVRFTPHQRIQHWILVIAFTTLVLTGFPIKFADRAWARWLIEEFGGLSNARVVHRWAGVLLMVGFAYHILYVLHFAWNDKRRKGKSWIKTIADLPMATNLRDLREMGHLLAYLLFLRKDRPQSGRFALKEKFEYFGVFWGSILLGITGIMMWANAYTTSLLTGRVLTIAMLIHTFEAFLALLHVGIIHMVGVIFSPTVFPLSPAMFTGQTPAGELAEAHGGMVTEVAQQVGIKPEGHHG